MKLFLASITLALSFASLSNAATVVWSASIDNGLSLADGSNLLAGNLVRVGTFDISDAAIAAAAIEGNIGLLDSHFTAFGNARIGDGVTGIGEHFEVTTDNVAGPGGLDIIGDQIYLWAFSSSNNSTVASSIASALQIGIFYLEKGVDGDWAFPTDDFGVQVDIDLTNLSNGNTLATGAHVVVGTFPNGTSDLPGNAPNFGLSIVPEPSVATAVIASVGLLALRRRRRS